MAKDFAAIYNSANDSSALEQKVFIKEEVTRGVMVPPTGSDFILQLTGGQVTFERPIESSPIRSGRHNFGIIRKKDVTQWNFPFYFMIDTTQGSAADAEIDLSARVLWKSLLGRERDTAGAGNLTYDSFTAPSTTFSIFENGDSWANQAPGSFVVNGGMELPGDGEAGWNVDGQSKTMYKIGIGLSQTDNNAGNIVTVASGEGARFEVGGMVSLVESDGVTRSADTPDGSPRTITDVTGDVVTLDGAVLADADFIGSDGFLAYYEPETPAAINDPQTGLVGSITIAGLTTDCVRSASLTIENNHEVQNFCYGTSSLSGPLFSPTDRLTINLTMDLNLNASLVEFINSLKSFDGKAITMILGDISGRHLEVTIPKWTPNIPAISIPDNGTIPVSFQGIALQTSADAADEITIEFK